MPASYREIITSFIISLMVNTISFYFFTIKIIGTVTLIFITAGSILLILMIGIQAKYSEVKEELKELKTRYKELSESLKINERLTKIETILNYGKRK